MTHRLQFKVTLTLRSPFLLRGLAGARFGIDTPHLRDEQNHPIFPADQVRGVFREALTDLAEAGAGIAKAKINDLFGSSSDDALGEPGKTKEPNRARIDFPDLTAHGWAGPSTETTRIQIDDDIGAAKTGMLQVIELVAPFGQKVRFEGPINVIGSADEETRIGELLNKAVGILSSIGAFKSPGFGEVVVEESRLAFVASTPLALPAIEPTAQGAAFHRLRVTFDRPLPVDAEKIADNAARGSSIVPGAVLKGALAQRLIHAGESTREGPLGPGALPAFPVARVSRKRCAGKVLWLAASSSLGGDGRAGRGQRAGGRLRSSSPRSQQRSHQTARVDFEGHVRGQRRYGPLARTPGSRA